MFPKFLNLNQFIYKNIKFEQNNLLFLFKIRTHISSISKIYVKTLIRNNFNCNKKFKIINM